MTMQGMPSIPAQSVTQCLPNKMEAEQNGLMIPTDESCKVNTLKKTGNKISFSLSCHGADGEMTGVGELERLGSDRYRGKMQMLMNSKNGKMEMQQSFQGQRIGSCDYQKR